MPVLPNPPFLCVVTDEELSADRIVTAVEAACTAGPIVVQLRARNRSGTELFELARRLRATTAATQSLMIVNDRLDVALAVHADGVHLPAAGIPPRVVRDLLERRSTGDTRLLIGLSVHSIEEIRANAGYVDYVQFGPLFATPSKAAFGPPQGSSAMTRAAAESTAAKRTLVAVGGIDATNAEAVTNAGAGGIAVIRAVMRASDPAAAARSLLAAISRRQA